MNHTGFLKGMLLGAAAGAAADMVLHTRTGRRTAAGKALFGSSFSFLCTLLVDFLRPLGNFCHNCDLFGHHLDKACH